MVNFKFILICHFGLEKVLKSEIRKLGLEIANVTDGEIKAIGTLEDIPRLNFNLRTCERIMIEINNFKATTFDELYNNVLNSEIEKFVPVDGEFIISKANQDKNSILHSSTAIQSIVKKAMVDRLKKVYNANILTESNGKYSFRVKFNKNICSLRLDTTGDSLHKRGYRIKSGLAPIEETLAAALVNLVDFNEKKILIDPFCGSGTIPIEAAMILYSIPPSIDRAFVSETWDILPQTCWENAKNEIITKTEKFSKFNNNIMIFGFDIDKNMIKISSENAKRAGVDNLIHFENCAIKDLVNNLTIMKIFNSDLYKNTEKIVLCNPPYGERLEDKNTVEIIYKEFYNFYKNFAGLKLNFITSYGKVEKIFGKALKNRKIYNGMIKTYLYSYG